MMYRQIFINTKTLQDNMGQNINVNARYLCQPNHSNTYNANTKMLSIPTNQKKSRP